MNHAASILIQTLNNLAIAVNNLHITPTVITGEINHKSWEIVAQHAKKLELRFAAIWTQQLANHFKVTACWFEGKHYLLISTLISEKKPEIHSYANLYPAANRLERHCHDLYGIVFLNHPANHRWTRHQAWQADEFPLRRNYLAQPSASVPPDADYPFTSISGNVYEIPVGPVHAGIIEPGHFRFHAAGENIVKLEERLGYVHKGIEKIAEQRDHYGLLRLAGRISGDTTVAHAWATAKACETGATLEVPKRALFLRAIMLERERIANHLGDMGALCNDVGFAFAYYQFGRLRELWQRLNHQIFDHRFLMDQITVGGVTTDLGQEAIQLMLQQIAEFKLELKDLYHIVENNYSLQDRFITTGILAPATAKLLNTLGYVGKASEQNFDVRTNLHEQPYDQFAIKIPSYTAGDVAARYKVRAQETLISLDLIIELLNALPSGNIAIKTLPNFKHTEGLGYVEGWRGEILTYVRFDEHGLVARYFPRDPSWLNWSALEYLVHNNIVPDFPLCNKSVNGSYAGQDL